MSYQYEFDNSVVGTLALKRADLLILHKGYDLLRKQLKSWNQRALQNGASTKPYEQEVNDLSRMLEWGTNELEKNQEGISVGGISVGSLRYMKAALLLLLRRREEARSDRAKEGWPSAALRCLADGIKPIEKFAESINYEPSDVLWEVIPRKVNETEIRGRQAAMDWDVFLSHASEDKDEFARPLAEGLRERRLRVWFDEFTLTVGDSLRRSIDRGLAHSRFGVVVISPNFLSKEWPQKELDGLVADEVGGVKKILPVWHKLTADDIRAYSPTLADRLAVSSDKGLDHVIAELVRAIRGGDPVAGRSERQGVPTKAVASVATRVPTAAQVSDLWVNAEYAQKAGLVEKLKGDGYDLKWESANNEAMSTDLEGWEHATIDRPDGTHARLKVRDAPVVGGYVVLLKRKKGFKGH